MGAGVPLPMKVNAPAHQKYSPTPSRSGNKPTIQTDGVKLTASADQDNRSQGTTPATVPGTRTVNMSVFRPTINWLLCHETAGQERRVSQVPTVSEALTPPD